jgi:hypothetical protein
MHITSRLCRGLAIAVLLTSITGRPAGAAPAPELLDRVLAVVSGSIITLSDARAAIDLGFVDVQRAHDPVAAALTWLIERRLALDEATRFETAERDIAAVDAAFGAVRRRFPSDEEWGRVKFRLGLTDDDIRTLVDENLQVQRYVEQRFATTVPASDLELQNYLSEHRADFMRGGQPRAFDEARADVESRVAAERRKTSVAEWLARLRRRAEVSELYTPVR